MRTDTAQRLRLTFGVEWPVCYASVLDLGRLWERLLRRAGLPLAYTQGFNPHPRMAFGMPLPVGYTSECEIVDLLLAEYLDPHATLQSVRAQCPPGLTVLSAEDIPLKAPALQATMREAEYLVRLRAERTAEEMTQAVRALLGRPSIPRARQRKGRLQEYDLRALLYSATYEPGADGHHLLRLRMACGSQGAGRPEELIDELGLDAAQSAIRRVRLVWAEEPRAGEEGTR